MFGVSKLLNQRNIWNRRI